MGIQLSGPLVKADPGSWDEVAQLSGRRLFTPSPKKEEEKTEKATGRLQACRLVFFPFSVLLSRKTSLEALAGKLSDFIGETGTHRDCAEKESWN